MRKTIFSLLAAFCLAFLGSTAANAGGWDSAKGLSKTTITGELVCVGCTLKRMDGANAQCDLYAQHALGVKTADGSIWNIVENGRGHDIIRGHGFLDNKQINIQGYLYPIANMIEIDSAEVVGVTPNEIAKRAWEMDQVVAKALTSRKVGEAPVVPHAEGDSHKH